MNVPEGWDKDEESLKRTYVFQNFVEAVEFVNKVAEIAEELNHHPDIRIFSYKNVEIILTTHDKGGLTEKDSSLAAGIDAIS